jgi:hypothetical protein
VGQNDILFIEIMAALGVIGVVAFLIVLISRVIPAQQRAGKGALIPAQQWYGYFLAAIVLTIATLLFLWRFPPSYMAQIADLDWQLDARSLTFFVIMLVILALALLAFIVFVIWQQVNRKTAPEAVGPAVETTASAATDIEVAKYRNPSGVTLLGLLALAVAYAILNWSYVPLNQQHLMMLQLVYPAGFVIALVMMFDKASRAWNIKEPGESLREWIFCNTVTFLYILGFLNLLKSSNGDTYSAMVVDLVNVMAFLFIFWMLDRKVTRLRFLVAYFYLIALPVGLLIWRAIQGVETVADISWWQTIWPFFSLAILFFVLEIIVLIITRESRSQAISIAKDIVFVALYIICLIAAIPEASAS